MRVDDFAPFYQLVHGHPPFPWQARLARRACEGDWPASLALPTASGKTSAIDVAVFALAWQVDLAAAARTARLRTAFVVDRRVVVDEAYDHARRLASCLAAPHDPLVAEVAARLRRFSGDRPPLHVTRLRGGVHRDETWAHTPAQPTVLVSTVDQVGSRLLFRGYGIPARSRPVHAGLLGVDTRILLDEAHLSAAFEDTVAFASTWQARAPRRADLPPPLAVTRLSATGRADADAFVLQADDVEHPVLRRRLEASKPTVVVRVEAVSSDDPAGVSRLSS